jgi:CRISPR-associated protein Csb2
MSSGTFWISATFLCGRYHGEEWPPSPVRLIQALVAGATNGGNRAAWPQVEQGLRWLESQPAPTIYSRRHRTGMAYRIAVPNNDFDVVAREWAAGRSADPAKIRTLKLITPRLMEEQAPHVLYEWKIDEGAAENAKLLLPAAHSLYSLGWGVDMAYADCGVNALRRFGDWNEWIPFASGRQQLKVPVEGFLDDLRATYARLVKRTSGKGVDTDTRISVYGLQPYARCTASTQPFTAFTLRTLDGESAFSRPWTNAMEIAAAMRHAAGIALRGETIPDDLSAYVFGHSENGVAADHRLSYLPLPTLHKDHGDGRIRRVLVMEPFTGSGRAVQILKLKWKGMRLISENREEFCLLETLWRDGVTALYLDEARVWRTVTPVILHGHNATRGNISVSKTERLLLRAFQMAGRSAEDIESLAFQQAPLWHGVGAAREIRVPKHLQGYPRYHVEVTFREPVTGPVIAGIGRHYGIGLFAGAS